MFYRLDNNQNASIMRDTGSLAWALTSSDIDGLVVINKNTTPTPTNTTTTSTSGSSIESSTTTSSSSYMFYDIPHDIAEIPLSRIPTFRGGLLVLSHDGEAVMRNGVEIDNSDKICSIPAHSIIYASERRLNSSNIPRYKIYFEGKTGWISERMRGSTEDTMLSRYLATTKEEEEEYINKAIQDAYTLNVTDRIVWEESRSIQEAVDLWRNKVISKGFGALLDSWTSHRIMTDSKIVPIGYSFNDYIRRSSTHDGVRQWSVEDDMQLSEFLSKTALKEGILPHNLSVTLVKKALVSLVSFSNITGGGNSGISGGGSNTKGSSSSVSVLVSVDPDRIVARASLIRVANRVIGHALPYFNTSLPEEMWRAQCTGVTADIDIVPTSFNGSETSGGGGGGESEDGSGVSTWSPPCLARRLRSFRRLLFNQTKGAYWDSVLEATTTPTSLHQDEYEDPREIHTVSINRVKAVSSRLSTITNLTDRVKQTVFGQLKDSMKKWTDASFRRAYLGKGHGGQKRAFKVKFLGEGVNDYGGPYRAVFEQVGAYVYVLVYITIDTKI